MELSNWLKHKYILVQCCCLSPLLILLSAHRKICSANLNIFSDMEYYNTGWHSNVICPEIIMLMTDGLNLANKGVQW